MVEADFEDGARPNYLTAVEAIESWLRDGDDDVQTAISLLGENEAADIYREVAQRFDPDFDSAPEDEDSTRDGGPDIADDDIVITSPRNFHLAYVAHQNERQIARNDDWDTLIILINHHMEHQQFYPNVWYVNERGNTDLLDKDGRTIRSWV